MLSRFPVGAPRDGINGATPIPIGRTVIEANLPPHSQSISFRKGQEQGRRYYLLKSVRRK